MSDMSRLSMNKSRTKLSSSGGGSSKRKSSSSSKQSKMQILIERYMALARNEDQSVIVPLKIKGGCEVDSFGEIVIDHDCGHFNSRKYIWPVGFVSRRTAQSFTNPGQRTGYTSRILRGNDGRPRFSVTANDAPNDPVISPSSSSAWTTVLKMANDRKPIGERRKTVTVSGPEMFGYSDSLVMAIFEELPNSNKCVKYWQGRTSFLDKMNEFQKNQAAQQAPN